MTEPRRRRFFRLPFRDNATREEADDEIQFHLDMKTEKLRGMGFSDVEAREEAQRRFGDAERVRDEVEDLLKRRRRGMRGSEHLDRLRRNSRYAIRQLARNPVFSIVAVLTVAIAIGATTSVYSVVDGILLRPLAYSNPDELVMVWADYTRRGGPQREWLSYPNFADFRDEVPAMAHVSLFTDWSPTLSGAGEAEQLRGGVFSYGMFAEVLDVEPAIGRAFTSEDDSPTGNVVLLSNGFWMRGFGGDPDIVGREIILDDEPQTVIGVMPADFRPPGFLGTDIWAPLGMDPTASPARGNASFRAVGRMVDAGSLGLARSQADALGTRLEQEFPRANQGVAYMLFPLKVDMTTGTSAPLWVLLGAVGVVLLIASVNVASLLLARGATREAELAVRAALGAGRAGILGQVMTESLILALIGGALGTALALGGTELLVSLAPAGTPRLSEVALDGRILGFAASVTALVGLLFGVLPALRASHTQPAEVLREGGRSGPNRRTSRARTVLVIGQIGLTLVLLVASGLLVRSFENLKAVDLGFDPENVLSMQIYMSPTRYPDAVARRAFMADIETRLAGIPGIEEVGSVNSLPLAAFDGDTQFTIEGEQPPEPGQQIVWIRRATVGYFDAMRIPVVAGRAFDANDTDEQTQVIIINETLAKQYFGSATEAVGQRLNVNSRENAVWRPIVGVVRDIKNFGLRTGSRNAMYLPFNQISAPFMFTVVRSASDPLGVASAVRREIGEVDATIAVAQLQPMEDLVFDALATDRFSTALLTGFALVALLLAVVGLYGVVSYGVSTRLREMGVRIALGAESSSIRGLVMRWALGMALMGIALGAAGAFAVTRLMQDLLFGVEAADPVTFGATAIIMAGAAVLASLIPALRATRIDPIKVLKAE